MGLRLLQIGLGGWGRNWVQEVTSAVPGIEPVAWLDLDATVRDRAAAELGLPPDRLFATLDKVPEGLVDAALVTVPLAAHAVVARAALEAGLHVLVEKPFTDDLAEARALVDLAEARGLRLMVGQNYRWFPAPLLARRLVRTREIGAPMACYVDFHFLFDESYRYFFLAEPLLSDMAIHHFDTMRFVLDDEPVEVSCTSWNEPESPFEGRPAAVATIRFARGTLASYRGSWISRGPITPYGAQWRIDGTKGTVEFTYRGSHEQREKLDRLVLHRPPAREAEAMQLPELPLKDRKGSLDSFARWIREGEPPEGASTGEDNLRSLALMFGAIRSAAAGGIPVQIADMLREAGR